LGFIMSGMTDAFCASCGTPRGRGATRCPVCGRAFDGPPAPPTTSLPASPGAATVGIALRAGDDETDDWLDGETLSAPTDEEQLATLFAIGVMAFSFATWIVPGLRSLLIPAWLACAVATAVVSWARGGNPWVWATAGAWWGPFGVLYALWDFRKR